MESIVIIPSYNNHDEVMNCIHSLEAQTYHDFSVIVVDDGSPQKLLQDLILSTKVKINYYWKTNEGAGKARNYALDKIPDDTQFVFFIDSDDQIAPDYLEIMVDAMKSNQLDFCQSAYIVDGATQEKYPFPNRRLITAKSSEIEDFILELFGAYPDRGDVQKINTALWACAFRKEIIEKNDLHICSERIYMSEDTLFKIDYLKHCNKIGLLPYAGYYYKVSGTSLTHKVYKNQLEVLGNFYNALKERLPYGEKEPDSIQRVYRKLLMYYTNTIIAYAVSSQTNRGQLIRDVLQNDIFIECSGKIKLLKLNLKNIVFISLCRVNAAFVLQKVGEIFGK